MIKPAYAKTAVTAKLISAFVFATLLPKSEISSIKEYSVAVQPGLCRTLSKTPKTGYLRNSRGTKLSILLYF